MAIVPVKWVFVGFLLIGMSSAQSVTVASKDTPQSPTEHVCLAEILIRSAESDAKVKITEAKNRAEQVRNAIRLGGAFADLAKANSQGPTAGDGGDIGCFRREHLRKPIGDLVFRMKLGEVSDVLKTKQGFVMLQVTDREPKPPMEEAPHETVVSAHATGVRGKVVGGFEHVAISRAYILVHRDGGVDVHGLTDAGGKYAIPLPLGVYDVLISADGYSPTSRKIEVTPDGMMVFDAILEFNGLGMEQMSASQ